MALSRDPQAALDLPDQDATAALAARLASLLRPGDAVLLAGPIGAGKTTLVRALLRAATGDARLDVPSPTFTLVQSYDLPGGVVAHHFDLWRLSGPDVGPGSGPQALAELGWEEALRDIVLVEWPERLGRLRPAHALTIELAATDEHARHATFSGWPDRLPALVGTPA